MIESINNKEPCENCKGTGEVPDKNTLHIHISKVLTDMFRVLRKRCTKFESSEFDTLEEALDYGINMFSGGFRVFRQRTYEWFEPLNTEVAKIAEKKKWGKS